MVSEGEEYSLIQPRIVERLKDRDYFRNAATYNYNLLALRFGCQTLISKGRAGDAHDFWLEDEKRTLEVGVPAETHALDHFKQASFICFWLRRLQPINETKVIAGWDIDPSSDRYRRRKRFLRYGNEYCALIIGYQICLNYEMAKIYPRSDKIAPLIGSRLDYFRRVQFPEPLISDFVMVLKHKNMSPHALYLLYKSLFTHPFAS
ncbi:MAG: hypothetical protein P4M09_13125 [Devosia sp.]|nr:hypothetical protein [Devosia sp.]